MNSKLIAKALLIGILTHGMVAYASVRSTVDDAAITTAVKAKMLEDKEVSGLRIHVETNDGLVTLKGTVQTSHEADKAIEIASSTEGVVDVEVSHLTIGKSVHPIEDAVITAKVKGMYIKEKLFGDKPTAVSTVHVQTKDGVVHLNGKVKSKEQANTAVSLAKSVGGVKEVISSLDVDRRS